MTRLVDISVSLKSGIASDPPSLLPTIEYFDHHDTIDDLLTFFPGATAKDLPDEEAWAIEKVSITTHSGTHLDAPYHFASTMNGGERAITIDEVPLDWCFQQGVKLDLRHLPDGHVATADDIRDALAVIPHQLSPLDIVLVNTRAGERYGHDDYVTSGCGIGREATLELLERGVKITGTDAWSWDAPFAFTAERYAATRDGSAIWEGHKAGRDREYCHLEKLANLDQLPATGFRVCCFPVKVHAASAGWTRAVAILDD